MSSFSLACFPLILWLCFSNTFQLSNNLPFYMVKMLRLSLCSEAFHLKSSVFQLILDWFLCNPVVHPDNCCTIIMDISCSYIRNYVSRITYLSFILLGYIQKGFTKGKNLILCRYVNILILSSLLIDILAEYRILCWKPYSFSYLLRRPMGSFAFFFVGNLLFFFVNSLGLLFISLSLMILCTGMGLILFTGQVLSMVFQSKNSCPLVLDYFVISEKTNFLFTILSVLSSWNFS